MSRYLAEVYLAHVGEFEAVIDAMIANKPMTGVNDLSVRELPHEPVMELMRRHGRVNSE